MLLIHCPNCDHDNTPGERFCAKCGVPLNLKPCPQCGKVDQLTAKLCSGCGAAFPPIALAHIDNTEVMPEPQAARETAPSGESPRPPSQGAWPLIVMAVVAGGIPLLWMNRARIPLPKAWQINGPDAAGSAVAPSAPPAAASASPPPAAPAALTNAPIATAPAADKEPPKRASPAAHRHDRHRSPVKTASARPCTEALAALGLCELGAEQK